MREVLPSNVALASEVATRELVVFENGVLVTNGIPQGKFSELVRDVQAEAGWEECYNCGQRRPDTREVPDGTNRCWDCFPWASGDCP